MEPLRLALVRIPVLALVLLVAACSRGGGEPQAVLPEVAVNAPPKADAGRDQSVVAGARVTLDGTGSVDPENDRLAYRWTLTARPAGSAATLSADASPRPTFVADLEGTYVASLEVSDGAGAGASATVRVVAGRGNVAPVADAGPAQTTAVGNGVTLDGAASADGNGDALAYAWTLTARPAGSAAALDAPASARPRFVADVAGTYTATLVVDDGTLRSAPATVQVTAIVGNVPPVADAGADRTVSVREPVTLDGRASRDPNGDALVYAWTLVSRPSGSAAALSDPASAVPSFVPDAVGDYVFGLVVSDPAAASAPATVTVTAIDPAPPVAATIRALMTTDYSAATRDDATRVAWRHTRHVLDSDGVAYLRIAYGYLPSPTEVIRQGETRIDYRNGYVGMTGDRGVALAARGPTAFDALVGTTLVPIRGFAADVVAHTVRAALGGGSARAWFVLADGSLWTADVGADGATVQPVRATAPVALKDLAIERARPRTYWERRRNGSTADDAAAAVERLYGLAADGTVRVWNADAPHAAVTLAVPGTVVRLAGQSQWGVFALTAAGEVHWLNADAAIGFTGDPGGSPGPVYDQPQVLDDGRTELYPTFAHGWNEVVRVAGLPPVCELVDTHAIACGSRQVHRWTMTGFTLEAHRLGGGPSFGITSPPSLDGRFDVAIDRIVGVQSWRESINASGTIVAGLIFLRADGLTVGDDNGALPLAPIIEIFP
jgi:hypothetical protein